MFLFTAGSFSHITKPKTKKGKVVTVVQSITLAHNKGGKAPGAAKGKSSFREYSCCSTF